MTSDFKLSAQLVGHDSDVRDVVFPTPELVVSASRDRTVRTWKRISTSPPTYEFTIANQIGEYVNSVTFLPPSKEYPEGMVISGGKDPLLDVRKPTAVLADNAERLLPGHSNNVCALAASPNGKYFVSGSWDNTGKVWNVETWESEVTLMGHEAAVWDVLPMSDTLVVTGCADKNIRIYDLRKAAGGSVQPRSTIHTPDVVRGLCRVPAGHSTGAEMASSHNDGVIRLWKLNGQVVGELHGHESFVYRLSTLPSGEIVSAAEDRTIRVWKGVECVQTITLPAISVWTVAVCSQNGDIVSGTSDGVIRIFTRDPERVADAETVRMFDEAVQSSSIPEQQLNTQINKEKLPGPEFLTTKAGTKEGQVQMIKEANGSITAHTWSTSTRTWLNVGTVVDAVASSGKRVEYKGKLYDFVFDVAIEEGSPALKLPYNLSDNPYDTATKFINDNELSLNYLDQVAQFITKNTQGATLGQSADVGGADPYGTESRYRPGEESTSSRIKALPQRQYLGITAAKYEPIFKKMLSINSGLVAASRKDESLNPAAVSMLENLREGLESNRVITDEQTIGLIIKASTQWDYADRLAPLDILRCLATSPAAAKYSNPELGSLLQIVISASLDGVPSGASHNENIVMMGTRAIANLFLTAPGEQLLAQPAESARVGVFLDRVLGLDGSKPIGTNHRNLLIALTTVAINYGVLASKKAGSVSREAQAHLLKALLHVLQRQTDGEVVFRALVGAGTLVTVLGKVEARSLPIEAAVKRAKDRVSDVRVKEVSDELLSLVS